MIISHKHKFIFTKPRKVASTSIEVALSKFCGPDDIITENVSSKDIDEDSYSDYARNQEGYFNHMRAGRIKQKVGKKVWEKYFVFTVVRNPWDMVVSRYFWNQKNATPRKTPGQVLEELVKQPFNIDLYGKLINASRRSLFGRELKSDDDFRTFVLKKLPSNVSNSKYYFDWRGKPFNNYVIRYENLDEDFKTVCEKIGVPYEPLPSLKTKTRQKKRYQDMYDDELREWVAKKFAKEIQAFGYKFE